MAEYKSNQVITRYLNFEKFITLLSLGLFIPRVDMFEDKLEGIIPYPDANTVGFNIEDENALNMKKNISLLLTIAQY